MPHRNVWPVFIAISLLSGLAGRLVFLREPTRSAQPPPVIGPMQAKHDQLRIGMTLAEVEAIMRPAGPNYSSLANRDHLLWKGKDGSSR
ncbi:MAG: hypothetical protein K2W96_22965 [Gemmataceae bacterium]|nr:hypothetical protein [Gemmataceae bacterium]